MYDFKIMHIPAIGAARRPFPKKMRIKLTTNMSEHFDSEHYLR